MRNSKELHTNCLGWECRTLSGGTKEHLFCGVHLIGELYGVDVEKLDDPILLEAILRRGIKDSGATLCSIQLKKFEPSGITVLALLSESHASLHTYPEEGALFLDAFTCGLDCRPEAIAKTLVRELNPETYNTQLIKRGQFPDSTIIDSNARPTGNHQILNPDAYKASGFNFKTK